jgi:hypothetical protein
VSRGTFAPRHSGIRRSAASPGPRHTIASVLCGPLTKMGGHARLCACRVRAKLGFKSVVYDNNAHTWFPFVPPVFTTRENNDTMARTGFQRALWQSRHVSVSVTDDGQVVAMCGSIFCPGVSVWVLSKSVQKQFVRWRVGRFICKAFVMEACGGARHVIAFQNDFLDRVHMFLLTGASLGGYGVNDGETLQVTGNCLVRHGTLALIMYALHSGEHMAALFAVKKCSLRVGSCAWQQGSKFYVRATLLPIRVVVEVDMAQSSCPTRMYVQQRKARSSGCVEIVSGSYVMDLGIGVLDRSIFAGSYGIVWHADKDGGTCRQAFCMSHARKSWMQACGL